MFKKIAGIETYLRRGVAGDVIVMGVACSIASGDIGSDVGGCGGGGGGSAGFGALLLAPGVLRMRKYE